MPRFDSLRRRFGDALLAGGALVAAWPAITWLYGAYWQDRLAAEFPEPVPARATAAPTPTPSAMPKAPRSPHPYPTPAAEADPLPPVRPVAVPDLSPPRSKPLPGGAFARLRIPRIDLDAVVVEGATNRDLRRGPGHLPGTGLPGEWRNCAIAAHRDGWFARLHELNPGDPVRVETPSGLEWEYTVTEKRTVNPDRADLLDRGPVPDLTLITCTGPGYPHSKYRLLVFCRLRQPE